jgi:hypothetical protein
LHARVETFICEEGVHLLDRVAEARGDGPGQVVFDLGGELDAADRNIGLRCDIAEEQCLDHQGHRGLRRSRGGWRCEWRLGQYETGGGNGGSIQRSRRLSDPVGWRGSFIAGQGQRRHLELRQPADHQQGNTRDDQHPQHRKGAPGANDILLAGQIICSAPRFLHGPHRDHVTGNDAQRDGDPADK